MRYGIAMPLIMKLLGIYFTDRVMSWFFETVLNAWLPRNIDKKRIIQYNLLNLTME